jgi:hypothetical protein
MKIRQRAFLLYCTEWEASAFTQRAIGVVFIGKESANNPLDRLLTKVEHDVPLSCMKMQSLHENLKTFCATVKTNARIAERYKLSVTCELTVVCLALNVQDLECSERDVAEEEKACPPPSEGNGFEKERLTLRPNCRSIIRRVPK